MKNNQKTKNELIAELESVRRKVKKLETLLKKNKHTQQDITELKQAEVALRESEEKHKALIETTDTGYLILDAQGKVIDANKEYIRLTGYDTLDEILGRSVVEWTAPHDLERNAIEVKKCAEQGYIRNLEIDYINRSEQITPIEINATVVGSGESVRILALCRDITERKRAEDALRESEERYRSLVEAAPDVIYTISAEDGSFTSLNSAFETVTGWSRAEWIGKPFASLAHPDDLPLAEQTFQRALRGETQPSYELRVLSKSGECLVGEFTSTPHVKGGKVVGELGIARDITQRKRAEEVLRLEKENFRRSLDESPLGVRIVMADGNTLYANRAILDFYGYDSLEELQKTPLRARYTPESYAEFQKRKQQRQSGDFSTSEYGISIVRKNGEVLHLQVHRKEVLWNDAQQFLVMYQDITERKLAEEELRENEDRITKIFRSIPDALIISRLEDGKIVEVNDAWYKVFGYKREEVIGKSSLALNLFADSTDRQRAMALLREQSFVRDFELQIRQKSGALLTVILSIELQEIHGEQYMISVLQDITERKRAEKQVFLLAHTLKSVAECVSITDLNDIVLFVNNTFLKTYGYSEHEILGKNINVVRSPNNPPEATRDILAATLAGGWSGELMNRTKDGRDFPVSLSTSFVRDEQGQDIALVGIATDITERKQEEEEISKSHEELRMLANHLQTIREEERNHLAREFHDQIGQSMTALKMDLSLLLRMISDEKQDMQRKLVIEELQSMQKLVDETSQLLWAIITELRPQMLDDLGLVATFEWEAQRFESRTGIPCEFKSFAGDIQIDSKKSIALFRIYQEALTNIARHANATVVKSVFQRVGEMLVLEIKDNGCGISIDEQFKQKPFGLIGMRERALAIGGLLEISGIAGEGTTIMVRLPIGQVATEESTRQ